MKNKIENVDRIAVKFSVDIRAYKKICICSPHKISSYGQTISILPWDNFIRLF